MIRKRRLVCVVLIYFIAGELYFEEVRRGGAPVRVIKKRLRRCGAAAIERSNVFESVEARR